MIRGKEGGKEEIMGKRKWASGVEEKSEQGWKKGDKQVYG